MQPVIRPSVPEDVAEIKRITAECFEASYTGSIPDTFWQFLDQDNRLVMVAACNDRVVGFIIYDVKVSELYLTLMAVDPLFQNRGVGRRLVARLIEEAPRLKRDRITLHRHADDRAPAALYASAGFRQVGVHPLAYPNGGSRIIMEYQIEPN
jgi:ribosomal-protein-alanine N-acetyltransferase